MNILNLWKEQYGQKRLEAVMKTHPVSFSDRNVFTYTRGATKAITFGKGGKRNRATKPYFENYTKGDYFGNVPDKERMIVVVFESETEAVTFMLDNTNEDGSPTLYQPSGVAPFYVFAVATGGASLLDPVLQNLKGYKVLVCPQNDEAGRKWLGKGKDFPLCLLYNEGDDYRDVPAKVFGDHLSEVRRASEDAYRSVLEKLGFDVNPTLLVIEEGMVVAKTPAQRKRLSQKLQTVLAANTKTENLVDVSGYFVKSYRMLVSVKTKTYHGKEHIQLVGEFFFNGIKTTLSEDTAGRLTNMSVEDIKKHIEDGIRQTIK